MLSTEQRVAAKNPPPLSVFTKGARCKRAARKSSGRTGRRPSSVERPAVWGSTLLPRQAVHGRGRAGPAHRSSSDPYHSTDGLGGARSSLNVAPSRHLPDTASSCTALDGHSWRAGFLHGSTVSSMRSCSVFLGLAPSRSSRRHSLLRQLLLLRAAPGAGGVDRLLARPVASSRPLTARGPPSSLPGIPAQKATRAAEPPRK